ncbi:hypothetical protein E7T09_13020 [Deinococcus sp. KSM4-11]|uniref:hypothetical protein n=1 Tax=Deinococcus sp. KSM4-11 TaxID=2568654 RepID=UPI0010A578F2|nr:hypothetical protein [Deinococcus sp. KSM4-11]THF86146.1 hypothetical protein E7T09_13020 [Deinococcus sp. KSM4-11]
MAKKPDDTSLAVIALIPPPIQRHAEDVMQGREQMMPRTTQVTPTVTVVHGGTPQRRAAALAWVAAMLAKKGKVEK